MKTDGRPEHNYLGNCCAGAAPSEECERHRQWRGECPHCPPCAACDLEWEESAPAEETVTRPENVSSRAVPNLRSLHCGGAMIRPRALDLFCRAGGVSEGLLRAGFDVVGVDILDCSKAYNRGPGNPERHERPAVFVQADALEYPLDGFDFIWASPPCQAYSMATRNISTAAGRPDLLPTTRERLKANGSPWCLENVPGAPMRPDLVLCGCMFGLQLRRARWFEMEPRLFDLLPTHNHAETPIGVYGNGTPSWHREKLGRNTTVEDWRTAMGIDWMGRNDLSQAIPPAYAEWIGRQAILHRGR